MVVLPKIDCSTSAVTTPLIICVLETAELHVLEPKGAKLRESDNSVVEARNILSTVVSEVGVCKACELSSRGKLDLLPPSNQRSCFAQEYGAIDECLSYLLMTQALFESINNTIECFHVPAACSHVQDCAPHIVLRHQNLLDLIVHVEKRFEIVSSQTAISSQIQCPSRLKYPQEMNTSRFFNRFKLNLALGSGEQQPTKIGC